MDIVAQSLSQLSDSNEKNRQLNIQERLDYYYDNAKELILQYLKEQFVAENYKNMKLMVDDSVNLVRYITERVASIYNEEPERYLIGDVETESTDDTGAVIKTYERGKVDDERFNEIYKDIKINLVMDKSDKLTFACNDCVLVVVPRNGRIEIDIVSSDKASVIQDDKDPTKIKALIYEIIFTDTVSTAMDKSKMIIGKGAAADRYYMYYDTEGRHCKFDGNGSVLPNEDNPDNVNPYKNKKGKYIIPAIILHDSYNTDTIWDDTSKQNMYSLQKQIAVISTLFNYYLKNSSHKQPYITGPVEMAFTNDQILDNSYPIKITAPQGGVTVGLLDYQGNLQEFFNQLNNKIGLLLNQYDLALDDFTKSGTPESGYKLAIKREGLRRRIEARKKLFRVYESELYEVIKIVNNTAAAQYGWQQLSDAEFAIDFADYTTQMSQEEINNNVAFEINYNISTVIDEIMKRNPDLTREQAEKQYSENKAINETKRGEFGKIAEAAQTAIDAFNEEEEEDEEEEQAE